MGDKYDDIRAAVARADEVLGCGKTECFFREGGHHGLCECVRAIPYSGPAYALAALYKAAKAVVEEADGKRLADAAMNVERDGDPTMFAEAFEEVCGHVRNASDESEPQIIPSLGLDFATLEPYLSRDVEFMGIRGSVTGLKMESSCMTPLDNTLKTCWCYQCLDDPSMGPLNPAVQRMIVCPECGNKRCPRATSHDNACSGSNEPGQDGSRYK